MKVARVIDIIILRNLKRDGEIVLSKRIAYSPIWNLDSIFKGGSESEEFKVFLENIEQEMTTLDELTEDFIPSTIGSNQEKLTVIIDQLEQTTKKLREAFAFVSCLSAQDINDTYAKLLVGKRSELKANMNAIESKLRQKLAAINDKDWECLLQQHPMKEIAFVLNETRQKANELLSEGKEVLINDLAIDGYHAWNQMYETIVGKITVEIEENGKVQNLSVGQAANKLSDPDREVRKHVYEQLQNAWAEHSDFFGQTLNHLAGFRLQTYKHRGWDQVLREPLAINRMKKETLDAMWTAISNSKNHFVKFLQRKANILGLDTLSLYDIGAPLATSVKTSSYTEGAHFIINHFNKFSPKMADFAKMAFENRWIEAEDRPGKRPGGFCTSFPDSEQTRIFMTYSGTTSNIATLAHELGHAYHQHVMNDLHGLNQGYAMNVAETASTFAEMIVADASVSSAQTKEEKMVLLEDKIKRSIAFFMNIHARFIFEQRFYEERKRGMVPVERLNELMIEAQKEAYCDAINDYDPTFWASKLHFHITGVPFYNFPYTFGYLFSLGIYAHAKKIGNFEDDYVALLRDTGRMTVEGLAAKHLNVDLTQVDFWEQAIQLCIDDVNEFLSL